MSFKEAVSPQGFVSTKGRFFGLATTGFGIGMPIGALAIVGPVPDVGFWVIVIVGGVLTGVVWSLIMWSFFGQFARKK